MNEQFNSYFRTKCIKHINYLCWRQPEHLWLWPRLHLITLNLEDGIYWIFNIIKCFFFFIFSIWHYWILSILIGVCSTRTNYLVYRLELKGNKYILGEFLEFKGKQEDVEALRNVRRSKVARLIIQKTSMFGLGNLPGINYTSAFQWFQLHW